MAWIFDLLEWIVGLVPRMTFIPPTHRGVRFGPRGGATGVGAGLVWWWPLVHRLALVPVTAQSMQVSARCAKASGDRMIPAVEAVALAVQFRIVDPVKAATSVLDMRQLVDNRCQAVAGKGSSDELLQELAPLRDEFGVEVFRVDVTHDGEAVALLFMQAAGPESREEDWSWGAES